MKTIRTYIDGDILIYSIASAVEVAIDWGDDWWGLYADMKEASQLLDDRYKTLLEKAKEAYTNHAGHDIEMNVRVVLSDSSCNWRHGILPSYKHNREGKRKPVLWAALRQYLIEKYDAIIWPRLEADDVIGILASRTSLIISDDKDFKTIPCLLYRPLSDTFQKITKSTARRAHLTQTLVGDSADGYKGCPGVGEVKADRILKKGTWGEVLGAYEKAGLQFNDALVQARVAHILNVRKEYKKIGARVRLWHPTYLGKQYGLPWQEDFKHQYIGATNEN